MAPSLQPVYPSLVKNLRWDVQGLFDELARCQTRNIAVEYRGDRPQFSGADVDFVAHVILHKLYKIYRNKIEYHYDSAPLEQISSSINYEVLAQPAVSGRLEIKLVDVGRDKVLWSAQQDSTEIVAHDQRVFLYNTAKYPTANPQWIVRTYLADILRLRDTNASIGRMMESADRWFVSAPRDDVETARRVLSGMTRQFLAALDSNLPLEGRIAALLPDRKGKKHVLLNIGARHGLRPKLRFDVRRPLPSDEKVGQIEVVSVDSLSAVARLRKLDKKVRKRGEGLQTDDRVISKKRKSTRKLAR